MLARRGCLTTTLRFISVTERVMKQHIVCICGEIFCTPGDRRRWHIQECVEKEMIKPAIERRLITHEICDHGG